METALQLSSKTIQEKCTVLVDQYISFISNNQIKRYLQLTRRVTKKYKRAIVQLVAQCKRQKKHLSQN